MKTEAKTAVLACGAFKRELQHICGGRKIVFLPPLLHLYPAKLQVVLTRRLRVLKKRYEKIVKNFVASLSFNLID